MAACKACASRPGTAPPSIWVGLPMALMSAGASSTRCAHGKARAIAPASASPATSDRRRRALTRKSITLSCSARAVRPSISSELCTAHSVSAERTASVSIGIAIPATAAVSEAGSGASARDGDGSAEARGGMGAAMSNGSSPPLLTLDALAASHIASSASRQLASCLSATVEGSESTACIRLSSSVRELLLMFGMERSISRAACSTESSRAKSSDGRQPSCASSAMAWGFSWGKRSARIAPMSSSCELDAQVDGSPPPGVIVAAEDGGADEASASAGKIARVNPTKVRATSFGSDGHATAGSCASSRIERSTCSTSSSTSSCAEGAAPEVSMLSSSR
mmetsp:Transcript_29901/g.91779  ORF Transcript_29901/g.91779 Transcript_29901/m.91779 type:complete len:337 (-) Transcript_29901:1189-2199(-)